MPFEYLPSNLCEALHQQQRSQMVMFRSRNELLPKSHKGSLQWSEPHTMVPHEVAAALQPEILANRASGSEQSTVRCAEVYVQIPCLK